MNTSKKSGSSEKAVNETSKKQLDCNPSLDSDTNSNVQNEWGKYGQYELVGQGEVTNPDTCGKFRGFWGCNRTELHNKTTLDGKNHKGKVYIKKVFHSCDKPTCKICFKRGWAVREAGNIEERIKSASKKFGLPHHVVASVPMNDYGLSFEELRRKARKVLVARGVHGGVLIFHAFRYANDKESRVKGVPFGWYWSPHFHCIGFIDDYVKCWHCPKAKKAGYVGKGVCEGCSGFEARTRRLYAKDKWIAEVLTGRIVNGRRVGNEGRLSIFGTAWYQLNHSSIKRGSTRFHVATWFGSCSYRKLKLAKEDIIRRDVCPICGMPLVRLRYLGFDFDKIMREFWIREFEDDAFDSSGNPFWVEAVSGSYG